MRRKWLFPLILLGVLLVAWLVLWPRVRPHRFAGAILQASTPISDFELTAHTGERVRLSDYRGKYVVLYFGYTWCPDVCPLTLSELAKMMNLLDRKYRDRVQVLFITVDPERDTPERLAAYAPHFDPSFVGLTGTPDEIAAAATPLGIFYAQREVEGASGYLMDHTASVTVLDDEGRVRLVWPFETPAKAMAADLTYLMR